MTKFKGKLLFMALLVMAFTVSAVHAQNSTWEVEQIESGPDDGFITETGNKYFDTPWVQIKSTTTSLTSYFAFRGVTIPENSTILYAALQFTAPGPTTFGLNGTLDVTIQGIKTGDLTSWDPTPDLDSEPFTNALVNWDATPLSRGASINVTVTDLVTEIYGLYSWLDGNDMGFRVLSVFEDSILAARYQQSYENSPNDAMKLYIEYRESNDTYIFYKGFTIISTRKGTGAVISWNDNDEVTWNLLTAEDEVYNTSVMIDSTMGSTPDALISAGTTIYGVRRAIIAPYNTSLWRTFDLGNTWEKLAVIHATPGIPDSLHMGLAYDLNDTIYVGYTQAWDTWVKVYTISNNTLSPGFKIFNGGFSGGEIRTFWDEENEVPWITSFGGTTGSSVRKSRVMRRYNGTWESHLFTGGTDWRSVDIIKANETTWAVVFEIDNDRYALYELTDDANISSWNQRNTIGNNISPSWDLGVWRDDPVIASEQSVGAYDYIYTHWYNTGVNQWASVRFNTTPSILATLEFHTPKIYYQGSGTTMLLFQLNARTPGGEHNIVYNPLWWFRQARSHSGLAAVSMFEDGPDSITAIGGDSYPYTAGSDVFIVYDENGTLIGEFDTLEDAEAGIDDEPGVGQTPDNPNPPGTGWAEEGFGELTRFNMRFVIWAVGWFLIIAPLIIMAVKSWPLKIYLIFVVCIALGFALQWSIGSI